MHGYKSLFVSTSESIKADLDLIAQHLDADDYKEQAAPLAARIRQSAAVLCRATGAEPSPHELWTAASDDSVHEDDDMRRRKWAFNKAVETLGTECRPDEYVYFARYLLGG